MFEREAEGLESLRKTNSFKIPEVIGFSSIDSWGYLLLEWLPPEPTNLNFWEKFAQNLARLHQTHSSGFGWKTDNYIGSLIQLNCPIVEDAREFYVEKRLKPQLKLAGEKGFTFKNLSLFYKNIQDEIPPEKASLIHGDLWSGNFLCTAGNTPALIDPATAFAPREMDIAMMKLFGGFPNWVFEKYNSLFPLEKAWEKRIEIWQLYYLLVHLNLFGSSYYFRVKEIISRYT